MKSTAWCESVAVLSKVMLVPSACVLVRLKYISRRDASKMVPLGEMREWGHLRASASTEGYVHLELRGCQWQCLMLGWNMVWVQFSKGVGQFLPRGSLQMQHHRGLWCLWRSWACWQQLSTSCFRTPSHFVWFFCSRLSTVCAFTLFWKQPHSPLPAPHSRRLAIQW